MKKWLLGMLIGLFLAAALGAVSVSAADTEDPDWEYELEVVSHTGNTFIVSMDFPELQESYRTNVPETEMNSLEYMWGFIVSDGISSYEVSTTQWHYEEEEDWTALVDMQSSIWETHEGGASWIEDIDIHVDGTRIFWEFTLPENVDPSQMSITEVTIQLLDCQITESVNIPLIDSQENNENGLSLDVQKRQVIVWTDTTENQASYAYTVFYDEDGRMINVELKELEANDSEVFFYSIPEGASDVKTFLLDKDRVPVQENYEVNLPQQGPAEIFTVTFVNEKGDAPEPQEVEEGQYAERPEDPTTEELSEIGTPYDFGGWFIDPDGEQEYDFSLPVTENITLYAYWEVTDPYIEDPDDYKSIIDYPVTGGNLQIDLDSGTVVYCDKTVTKVVIPEEVTGETSDGETVTVTVKRIGRDAFSGCNELQEVTLPETIVFIGEYAFSYCRSLTEIRIPASVITMGTGIFDICSSLQNIDVAEGNTQFTSVDGVLFYAGMSGLVCYPAGKTEEGYAVPEGVKWILSDAFYGSEYLQSVTLPEGLESINDYAFGSCGELKEILFPASLKSIGFGAFSNCFEMKAFSVSADNPNFSVMDGVLFNKNKTELFLYPCGREETSYSIPNTVQRIGDGAFYECDELISIIIPDSVTEIGKGAFRECGSLSDLVIPDSVRVIEGEAAFNGCGDLTSLTLPEGTEAIGAWMFGSSGIQSVYIPSSVTFIDEGGFNDCEALTDVYFGGTEAQWSAIEVKAYNDALAGANIHYNSSPSDLN